MDNQELRALLEQGIADGAFPAAAAAVEQQRRQGPALHAGAGSLEGAPLPECAELVFDYASLTKPFVAAAVWRLAQRGELSLDCRLGEFFPEIGTAPLGDATVELLLCHEAGLEPWLPLFEQVPMPLRGSSEAKLSVLEGLLNSQSPRVPTSRAVYSDLGFILLGELLDRCGGRSLAGIVHEEVCAPLGLNSVSFRSIGGHPTEDSSCLLPTEDCPWRGRVLSGEVHDDNAWTMGGIAGHAGLFGTARDLARFGRAWLDGLAGTSDWLDMPAARRATSIRPSGRTLGFDSMSPSGSSAGTRMGSTSFGHLGYTGGSLWCDPKRGIAVALTTNRVRFGRQNTGIRAYRPWFHDELIGLLEGADKS